MSMVDKPASNLSGRLPRKYLQSALVDNNNLCRLRCDHDRLYNI